MAGSESQELLNRTLPAPDRLLMFLRLGMTGRVKGHVALWVRSEDEHLGTGDQDGAGTFNRAQNQRQTISTYQ